MRQESRFTPGPQKLSAARLNALEARLKRLENFRVNRRYLRLTQDASGPYLDILPFVGTIAYANIGATTIPAKGVLELVSWRDDDQAWDGRRPTSPGLVKIAVNAEIDVAAGDSGIAYTAWANPGAMQVLAKAGTDATMWLYANTGTCTSQWVRDYAELKVIAAVSGFTLPLAADGPVYCRFE